MCLFFWRWELYDPAKIFKSSLRSTLMHFVNASEMAGPQAALTFPTGKTGSNSWSITIALWMCIYS